MKTSAAGRTLIVAREGRRLIAYRDQKGILTIGVGHTGRMAGPPVTPGQHITPAQCDALLAEDLAPVEAMIAKAVKVPLAQNEYDALASLGFNIGVGGLARSSVVRRLNAGDTPGAADAFLAWSKPSSLAGRRRAERAQFLTPDAAPDDPAAATAVRARRTEAAAAAATRSARRVGAAAPAIAVSTVAVSAAVSTTTTAHHAGALVPILAGGLVVAALVAGLAWSFARRAEALRRSTRT